VALGNLSQMTSPVVLKAVIIGTQLRYELIMKDMNCFLIVSFV
jgi:hypothetical protein